MKDIANKLLSGEYYDIREMDPVSQELFLDGQELAKAYLGCIQDAERYRALRDISMTRCGLEAWVALNGLDFVLNAEAFDSSVDTIIKKVGPNE